MQLARSRIGSVALALSTLWLAAPALLPPIGNVLVVDDDGSAPFTTIQSAVDATIDGDVVLVRPGTYGGFLVANKSLVVVGDLGAAIQVQGSIRVVDLAASRVVVLANLSATGAFSPDHELSSGLALTNNAGPVRVESCALSGSQYPGALGAQVRACGDAALVGCQLRGGPSLGYSQSAHGLAASESSVVTIYGGIVEGGEGLPLSCAQKYGRDGGDGGHLDDTFLFGANSSFLGGRGGSAMSNLYFACPFPGDGGDGIHAENCAVYLLDTATVGGLEGERIYGNCGPCLLAGYAGEDRSGGTFSDLLGGARLLFASTPAFAGTTTTITLRGTPGDRATLLLASTTSPAEFVPAWHGMLLVPRPRVNGETRVLVAGTIPANGMLSVPLALPPIAAGGMARTYYLQALFRDAQGQVFLSGARSLTALP